ncbi:hypothetical protein AWC38_SpisGene5457 [Stylophora pistillata]|uniref:Death domain-containing protein n=1 Tax=Stylophora pistillata TaxID=50429 RepID=A0A2B4SMF1_STYPI|nr:hypothetical protein AWC38_SpisGene5457 [Stylophora pistillata]
MDAMENVTTLMDPDGKWQRVGQHYNIDQRILDNLKPADVQSPTKTVLEYIVKREPTVTMHTFLRSLKNIKRLDVIEDLKEFFYDEIPPWYSPDKPKPVYESENVKAYWDVPIYADQQEVRCNRVDARIVNHMCKRVVTLEMSCPWVNNRTRKDEEKTLKYGPLRWELRQQFPGYEVKQYNIIMDALGGWSRELDVMMRELVGGRSTDVLRKMQRAVLSGTLNIARTFKVAV